MAFLEDLSPPTPAQQAALDRQNEQLHQVQAVRADGPAQVADIARRIGSAAVAIGQNLLRIKQRTADEQQAIRQICAGNACGKYLPGARGRCAVCGCLLMAKIVNAEQHCPLGLW